MREPALAQRLEAAPAVVRLEADGEDFTHFAVEVREAALRMIEHPDLDIGQTLQALGEQPQRDTLAGTGFAVHERKAALR